MTQDQATSFFLGVNPIYREKIPLTAQQMDIYRLVKLRTSGGTAIDEAIKQVSKLSGLTKSKIERVIESCEIKGWKL